jgi:ankyrin repeat protein
MHMNEGVAEATQAFLAAVRMQDIERAKEVLRTEPRIAQESLHVAAVLGLENEVRRLLAEDPAQLHARIGHSPADPLLWLCYSPFHGESAERDAGLVACARALLDAGADPNTKDAQYDVPVLYAVTGMREVPRIARMLIDAGANPTDGESVFHAAESYHVASLEMLLAAGADLNHVGDWGNTALWFLLRWHDAEREPRVKQGLVWLLEHGADPNIRSGRDRETALHVAVRRGQAASIVRLLLEHGADVHARRGDGRTSWILARRGGFDELASILEEAGAARETLAPADELLAACGRGDAAEAKRRATPEVLASLGPADFRLLPEAASEGRAAAAHAYLEAGFPTDTTEEHGATALHHAAIHGNAALVRALLRHGADFGIVDPQHFSTPMGWACFGADFVREQDGDYAACVHALLDAGASLRASEHAPRDALVRALLREQGLA